MQRAVFLDRDGVINKIIYHQDIGVIDSPFTIEQFQLLEGAAEAIRRINEMGLLAIVVTNQPGIAKGHFNEQVLGLMNAKMISSLAENGAYLDDIFMCLHHPQGAHGGNGETKYIRDCNCRKPKPGLLIDAAKKYDLELSDCYIVGDSITDIQAGAVVGCTTVLIGSQKCDLCRHMEREGVKPDFIADCLLKATGFIRGQEEMRAKLGRRQKNYTKVKTSIETDFTGFASP